MISTCFLCKGEMVDGFNNYMVDIDGHFVIIKNVPCRVCKQCGDVTYSGKTAARLEVIVDGLRKTSTEVTIVDYVA